MKLANWLWVFYVALIAAGCIWLVSEAKAHPEATAPGPGLHKILNALGIWEDPAPRPGPKQPCTWEKRGKHLLVWDERLGAYVEWVCRCTAVDSCRWFRLRIVERKLLPWESFRWRYVWDRQRACDAIVCLTELVLHRYPTKWRFDL
jgi:hypothetical protein